MHSLINVMIRTQDFDWLSVIFHPRKLQIFSIDLFVCFEFYDCFCEVLIFAGVHYVYTVSMSALCVKDFLERIMCILFPFAHYVYTISMSALCVYCLHERIMCILFP